MMLVFVLFLRFFYFADYRNRVYPLTCVVVRQRRADCLLRKNRTVYLNCRKPVESLYYRLICQLQRIVYRLALDELRRH